MKSKLWTKDFTLIIIINFLVFMNHIMILNTFPMFLETLGQDEDAAGVCAVAFSAVAVVLRPFIGYLLDGGRRKSILIIGIAGMFLMPIGYALSGIMAALGYSISMAVILAVGCRMLQGASLAFSNTSTATIASDALPKSRFAEGMGYFGMATALATSVAPALSLFLVSSVCMAAAFVLFVFMKTHAKEVKPERTGLSLSALIEPCALPASVICLVFLFTWGALENFLSKFALESSLPSGGIFFLITAVMLLLVRMFMGTLADRLGEGIFVYTCNFH